MRAFVRGLFLLVVRAFVFAVFRPLDAVASLNLRGGVEVARFTGSISLKPVISIGSASGNSARIRSRPPAASRYRRIGKNGDIKYLRPDGKSQVTVEYDGDRPVRVDIVVISTQHDPDVPLDVIRREVTEGTIDRVVPRVCATTSCACS